MMVVSRRSEKTGQRRIRRFADSPFRRFMLFLVCVLAIAMTGASFAQDEASNAKPDAGGVVIEPSSGKIAEGDTITITFPVSMVAADLIVNGLFDAKSRRPLPYLQVMPAGKTEPL